MSLKPLPDIENAQAMTKLGRLSAIRNSRADALHMLRDCCVRLQSHVSDERLEIESIEACLARLKELSFMQAQIT